MSDEVQLVSRVGPSSPLADGAEVRYPRVGRFSENVFSFAGGEYEEAASRGELYCACNQAETTLTTALTLSAVNFTLSNSAGSPVDLVLLQIGIALRTSSTAGHVLLAANVNNAAAAVVHTTPLIVRNCKLDGSAGYGLADVVATLPATPVAIMALLSAGVTVSGEGNGADIKGAVVIGPGTSVTVQGITVVGTAIISMIWRERRRLTS